jgi:IS30 family transposase
MNEKLQSILDQMPAGPPRSKLEPYRDLIRNLRQKRKTYREIAAFLDQHCNVGVHYSTIYDFVHAPNRNPEQDQIQVEPPQPLQPVLPAENIMTIGGLPNCLPHTPDQDLHARIAAIKRRKSTTQTSKPVFHYEEGEPLRLISDPNTKEQRR